MKEKKGDNGNQSQGKNQARNPTGKNQYDNPQYAQKIIGVRLYKDDYDYLQKWQEESGESGLIVQFIRDAVRDKLALQKIEKDNQ